MKIDLSPKHVIAAAGAFTLGYLLTVGFGTFGLHEYLAGLIGNVIGFILVYWAIEQL